MKVKELKNRLEDIDDEHEVIIEAQNAPPWITLFGIRFVEPSDENEL